MADVFTWNNPQSLERAAIERFLREVQNRIAAAPNRFAFRSDVGNLVINTMRAMLDKKPSEMREADNDRTRD